MLSERSTYDALYGDFRWDIPNRFNIGTAVSNAWAVRAPDRQPWQRAWRGRLALHVHPARPVSIALSHSASGLRSSRVPGELRRGQARPEQCGDAQAQQP